MPGADDYEVQVVEFDVKTGGQSTKTRVVSDPQSFETSFGRVAL